MGFFEKIAIARSVSRYSDFCAMMRELLNSKNYGLKALLCERMRSPYVHVNRRWAGSVDLTHRANKWRTARKEALLASLLDELAVSTLLF